MLQNFDIQTVQDVEAFLRYVVEPQGLNLGMGFHPDDDFDGYGIAQQEANQLNETLDKCFTICEQEGKDLYEIALNIIQPIFQKATQN